jgi:predicted dehydrogenase
MLKALVIGLGQIGMGYDLKHNPNAYVLTHARAFEQHSAFKLIGSVDIDSKKRDLFEQHYQVPTFSDFHTAAQQLQPDVISVAAPTALHIELLNAILNFSKPKAVLCEKPMGLNPMQAGEVENKYAQKDCRLYVNYTRRCDPGAMTVKQYLRSEKIMGPVKGVVWYSKGIFNNGSHFLNLLQYWLGPVKDIAVIRRGRMWEEKDPEPDVELEFEGGIITLLAAREEDFSHYTVELIARNGRLRYDDGGERITWQAAAPDSVFDGYTVLTPHGEEIHSQLHLGQWHVADQMAKHLSGSSEASICSGAEAIDTLEVLSAIRAKI